VTLKLPNGHPKFACGDVLMVLPPNDPEVVQCFLDLIKLDGATMLNIQADTL